jgi:hypothetical protein
MNAAKIVNSHSPLIVLIIGEINTVPPTPIEQRAIFGAAISDALWLERQRDRKHLQGEASKENDGGDKQDNAASINSNTSSSSEREDLQVSTHNRAEKHKAENPLWHAVFFQVGAR